MSRCLGKKKPFGNAFDGLITKSRLPTSEDDKLVKEFSWENKQDGDWKSTNFRLFSSEWVLIHRHSKSSFWKWPWILSWSKCILLVDIPTQILLTIIGSIDYSFVCKLHIIVTFKQQFNVVYRSHSRVNAYFWSNTFSHLAVVGYVKPFKFSVKCLWCSF